MADEELKRLLEGLFSDLPAEAGPEETSMEPALVAGDSPEALRSTAPLAVARLQRHALYLQTASQVSRAATSILDLDQLLPQVVDLICGQFGFHYAGIFLLDGEWAVLQAGTGEAGRLMVEQGHRLKVGGESMIGSCLAQRQARIALDVGEEAVRFDNPFLPDTRSEMALPLISRGQVLGAMTIQSAEAAAFSDQDITVLQTMADQLANAIENARLFRERERRVTELAVVNEIGQSLGSSREVGSLLELVHQQVNRLFDTRSFYIATYQQGDAEWTSAFHLEDGQRQPPARYPVGSGLTGYILRHRQPVLLRSIEENVAFKNAHGIEIIGEMARSWLGVPLLAADKIVGVMAIQNYEQEHLYGEGDLSLFATIAAQVATAIDNTRLLAQTRRRARALEAINEVGGAITSVLDLDAVLRQIVDITKARFGHYFVSIALVEGDQIVFRHGSTVGDTEQRLDAGGVAISLSEGQSLVAEAARTGQPILVHDVRDDPRYLPVAALPDTRSELTVPIEVKGRIIGALDVQSNRPWAYDETDVALLQSLGNQAGVAIENARLFEERGRRITELAIVNEIGRAAALAPELPDLLETTYDRVGRLFDAKNFYIATHGEGSEEWHLMLDVEQGKRQPLGRHKVEAGLTGHIIRTRQPLLLHSQAELEAFHTTHGIEGLGKPAKSWMGVPLVAADKVIGVMALQSYEHEFLYSEQDLALLYTIGAQAASAMENLRLLEQTRLRARELTVINEVGRAISSVLDLDLVLRQLVDAIKKRFGHYFVGILLIERDQLVFRSGSLVGSSDVRWERGELRLDLDGYGLNVAAATSGQQILVNDVSTDSRYGTVEGLDPVRAELDTPILVRDRVIGTLTVQSDRPNAFDESDLALLQSLASQAAVAIENARLFEQLEGRVAEMGILNEISQAVSRQLDLDRTLETIHEQVRRIISVDTFFVALYDQPSGLVRFPYISDQDRRYQEAPTPLSPSSNLFPVIESGEPLARQPHARRDGVAGLDLGGSGGRSRVGVGISALRSFAPGPAGGRCDLGAKLQLPCLRSAKSGDLGGHRQPGRRCHRERALVRGDAEAVGTDTTAPGGQRSHGFYAGQHGGDAPHRAGRSPGAGRRYDRRVSSRQNGPLPATCGRIPRARGQAGVVSAAADAARQVLLCPSGAAKAADGTDQQCRPRSPLRRGAVAVHSRPVRVVDAHGRQR